MNSLARKGEWFQTYTGKQFWPSDPRPKDFNIVDIATSLSNLCRFGGHVKEFYSVAQHSVLVSQLVPSNLALEGLLHDAAEAYIGDVIRPLKLALPDYRSIEERLERAIAGEFGLRYPWPAEIKDADNCLLMTERRDILPVEREWGWKAEPLKENIVPWPPQVAREKFLDRYRQLCSH